MCVRKYVLQAHRQQETMPSALHHRQRQWARRAAGTDNGRRHAPGTHTRRQNRLEEREKGWESAADERTQRKRDRRHAQPTNRLSDACVIMCACRQWILHRLGGPVKADTTKAGVTKTPLLLLNACTHEHASRSGSSLSHHGLLSAVWR